MRRDLKHKKKKKVGGKEEKFKNGNFVNEKVYQIFVV